MIDLYYAPTPNGHKITLFLEEAELAYRLLKVDISKGNQFRPDFLAISPNNKIPAIVDHAPADGGQPLSLFESGEILLYLAEKSGKLLSGELRERHTTLQWLFWQVGGLGPMLGQNHHFNHFAPQAIPYAIERYQVETQRLYNVLNKRLETSPWLGGDHYSIADIASWRGLTHISVSESILIPTRRCITGLNAFARVLRQRARCYKRNCTVTVRKRNAVAYIMYDVEVYTRKKPASGTLIRIKKLTLGKRKSSLLWRSYADSDYRRYGPDRASSHSPAVNTGAPGDGRYAQSR